MKKWNAPEIEMANVNETACHENTTIETHEEDSVSGATVITEPLEDNNQSSCGYGYGYGHKNSKKYSYKHSWCWGFWW